MLEPTQKYMDKYPNEFNKRVSAKLVNIIFRKNIVLNKIIQYVQKYDK